MPEDLKIKRQKMCQIKCQNVKSYARMSEVMMDRIECQKECQTVCQKFMQYINTKMWITRSKVILIIVFFWPRNQQISWQVDPLSTERKLGFDVTATLTDWRLNCHVSSSICFQLVPKEPEEGFWWNITPRIMGWYSSNQIHCFCLAEEPPFERSMACGNRKKMAADLNQQALRLAWIDQALAPQFCLFKHVRSRESLVGSEKFWKVQVQNQVNMALQNHKLFRSWKPTTLTRRFLRVTHRASWMGARNRPPVFTRPMVFQVLSAFHWINHHLFKGIEMFLLLCLANPGYGGRTSSRVGTHHHQ